MPSRHLHWVLAQQSVTAGRLQRVARLPTLLLLLLVLLLLLLPHLQAVVAAAQRPGRLPMPLDHLAGCHLAVLPQLLRQLPLWRLAARSCRVNCH